MIPRMFVIVLVFGGIFFTNAAESNGEIYCPGTEIAVDGKCRPVNYVNPLYWILVVVLVPITVITIFVLKSKSTKN